MFIYQRPMEVRKPERIPFACAARKLDPDALAVRGIDMRLAGVRRILIEAEVSGCFRFGAPTKHVRSAARQYQHIVTSISHRLRQYAGTREQTPEDAELYDFIARRMREMKITYGTGTLLFESVGERKLDCDNGSFLIYDIMKEAGLNGYGLGLSDSHAFVTGPQMDFETTLPPESGRVAQEHSRRPAGIAIITFAQVLDALAYGIALHNLIGRNKMTEDHVQRYSRRIMELMDEAAQEAPGTSELAAQISQAQRHIGKLLSLGAFAQSLKGTELSMELLHAGDALMARAKGT